jgi:DNA-binding LytR/AlgR family response regulator
MSEKDSITIKIARSTYRKFDYDEIILIKADRAYLEIHTADKTYIVTGISLDKLEQELLLSGLIRVNRSYIVSIDKCVEFKDCCIPEIKLINSYEIKPVTKNLSKIKEYFEII